MKTLKECCIIFNLTGYCHPDFRTHEDTYIKNNETIWIAEWLEADKETKHLFRTYDNYKGFKIGCWQADIGMHTAQFNFGYKEPLRWKI
jgi:hypothetical protein